MMYSTHVKVGKVFYVLSLPIVIKLGLHPSINNSTGNGLIDFIKTLIVFAISILVGYHGAKWGSGYPDLDLKNSEPDRRNPILGRIIRSFGVEHRGKFTHSLDSITLTFFIALILVKNALNKLSYLEDLPEIISNMLSNGGTINNLLVIWFVMAWVGAVSHLFGDASTKSGIRIFFFMPKFRIVPKRNFFRTGNDSSWEKIYNKFFSFIFPLSIALSIYLLMK